MKILLITNKSPWPPRDGGSAATYHMIRAIASKGVQVTVASLNTSRHPADQSGIQTDGIAEVHMVYADTAIDPVAMTVNLLFSREPYNLKRFESDDFADLLARLLVNSYDIIQVEGLAMAWCIPLIRTQSPAKVIYRPHNVESEIWKELSAETTSPLHRYYFGNLSRRIRRTEAGLTGKVDGIAAMTGNDMAWFAKAGFTGKAIVAPPGFIIDKIPDTVELPCSVGFIGALDWLPNINGLRWFIKNAWPGIIRELPEARLHIAGRNPDARLKKICDSEGIVFHGEIPSSADFMNGIQVIVTPLFSGSGVRMKIIEAMTYGRSIVASPAAAEGLVYERDGDLIVAYGAEPFSRAVVKLMRDEQLRKRLGDNAKENVRKNYDIFESADRFLRFYSSFS